MNMHSLKEVTEALANPNITPERRAELQKALQTIQTNDAVRISQDISMFFG